MKIPAFSRRRPLGGVRRSLTVAAGLIALAILLLATPAAMRRWIAWDAVYGLTGLVVALVAWMRAGRATAADRVRGAVLAERRRAARDLHDGLAQDLAVIAAHGPQLAALVGESHPVAVAARRALGVSREAIAELSSPDGVSLRDALLVEAHDLGQRFGLRVEVGDVDGGELDPDARLDMLRIVGEAAANAARHGHARRVSISLRRDADGHVLTVQDDGAGVAPDDLAHRPAGGGFGLRSMRERASVLGGELSLASHAEGGAVLEVNLP
jgi:signal transduction histidine kinase